ncbi:glycosyl transferase [Caballeronia jiangsuensis]|nr:glycosyl transferase [Caballeronia jiangsuensis]
MSDFSNITLVSVTGLNDARGAAYSLALSSRQMPQASVLLISPARPADLPPHIRHRVIAPLSYHEYSWFIMFALWKLIDTEFALIVQEDGWILDIRNWSDDFLNYDYLGAPIALGRVDMPEGIMWMQNFTWCEHLNRPDRVVRPVLNGGFSLRSRRMLRALIDHPQIRVEIPPPEVVEVEPIRMEWFHKPLNEDVQLSAALRPQLEAVGLKFAPLDLCLQFAAEDIGPLHVGRNINRLFGLHGWWRRLVSIDPPTVRYGVTRQLAEHIGGERVIIAMLQARGYRIEFDPAPR